ncbi:MAG: TlyA family RNA methyltransferase [bacterium]
MRRERLDKLMVERGLVRTRAEAQGLILAGEVSVNGEVCTKAGRRIQTDCEIEIAERQRYVGRGGYKLEGALNHFGIFVEGKVAIDVGASTGGFTDCLLKRGAVRVYAIDVGYGQLAWELRSDPRVIVMERTNARHLKPSSLPEKADLATIDVSFISLKLIIPPVLELLKPQCELIALIKPQFEAGRAEVCRGGIVRSPEVRGRIVEEVREFVGNLGMEVVGVIESPIAGADGNVEYLLYARRKCRDIDSLARVGG